MKKRNVPPHDTYAYRPSREGIRAFKDFPADAKLEWLEHAVRFVEAFVSPERRARWDRRWQRDHASVTAGHEAGPTPRR